MASQFAVVEFINEHVNGKKQIELVPLSWLTDSEDPQKCYYPPEAAYPEVEDMVKNLKPPKSTWEKFEVKTLKFTKTFKRGKRKLQEASRREISIDSTDSGLEGNDQLQMSRSQIRAHLQKSKSIQSLSTILENGSENNSESSEQAQQNATRKPEESAENHSGKRRATNRQEMKRNLEARMAEIKERIREPETVVLLDYLTLMTDLITLNLTEKMDTIRRGMQFDINKLSADLKESVIAVPNLNVSSRRLDNPKSKFPCTFPIDGLQVFLQFEKTLNPEDQSNVENPELAIQRQEALKDIMEMEVGRMENLDKVVPKIMSALIKPNVQREYSGVGRQTYRGGKKNFSATFTFRCLEGKIAKSSYRLHNFRASKLIAAILLFAEFLKLRFNLQNGSSKDLDIIGRVSHFLWGADDRAGGAAARKKKALLRALNDESKED